MKQLYFLRTLVLIGLLWFPVSSYCQAPSLTVSTTNCSTWNCSPCDGSFTLTLNNPIGPGPYTFWLMDTTNWTIVDSITTFSTSYTFTGLCSGYYYTDIAWQNVGGPICTNCTGGSSPCPQCPPTGSGGGGAGGAVGAPDPPLIANLTYQYPECQGLAGNWDLQIVGAASPFMVSVNGAPFVLFGSALGGILYCSDFPPDIEVMDATGQIVFANQYDYSILPSCIETISIDPVQDITLCSGESVSVDFSGYQGFNTIDPLAVWWNSSFGNILNIQAGYGTTFSYTAPLVNSISSATIDLSAGTCSGNESFTITVHPPPTIDAGLDIDVCEGNDVTLAGSGGVSYVWTGPVATISDGNAFLPNIGVGQYTVVGTDANGCTASDDVFVTTVPLPQVDAGPDITVCAGESVILAGLGDGILTWNNGVLNNSSFIPSGSMQLILTAEIAPGCTSNDTMQVTVLTAPVIDAGPDITECEFAPITLTSSYPNGVWSGAATSGFVPAGYSTATLTVDWGNGCSSLDTITIFGEAEIFGFITPDMTVCEGDTVILISGSSLGGIPAIETTISGATIISGVPFIPPVGTWYNSVYSNPPSCVYGDAMELIVHPAPYIDAGLDVAVCLGDSIELNATGVGTITWSTGTNNGDWYTPQSNEYAIATLIDGNGCEKTDSIFITVNPIPTIDAGPDQTVCLGDSIVLTATGGTSYAWNNTVIDGNYFIPSTTEWYTVEGTDANGCMNLDSLQVTVNQLPIVDAGLDQTVCRGDSVTVTGNGANSYVWNNNVFDNVPFEVQGIQECIVVGTDINGCQSTDTVTIFVNALPIVDAGSDTSICLGDSIQLNVSGNLTLVWSNGVQNGDWYVPQSDELIYVEGTDANGCISSDSIFIAINLMPTVDAGNDVYGCENDPITLTANGSQGTITWSGNTNPLNTQITSDSIWYFATITDSIGCFATDSVLVFGDSIPIVSFVADAYEGCAPLQVTFTNTTIGNMNDCSWSFGNQTSAAGCGNQTVVYSETGYYDVSLSVTTLGGCFGSLTLTDYIYVEPDPIANFGVSPTSISELDTYVETINYSTGATSYVWDFGDNSGSSFNENESHVYPMGITESYIIELVAYSPLLCSDTAWQSIVVEEEVIFYVPNSFTPNGDEFNNTFGPVITSGVDLFDFEFIVFDRWGEIVFLSQNADVFWDGTYASKLCQDGTYNWRLEFKVKNRDERQIHYGHVNLLK